LRKSLLKDEFEDEKAKLEREIQRKTVQVEKELAKRKAISEKEEELNGLRKNVSALPKELETAVNKAENEQPRELQQRLQAGNN
jgi:dynactin complex subunit